jgi:Ser/Thr protein kinase RdoA (MazF antagonist)
VYFKAAFSLFQHEPGMTAALAEEHRGLVPDVVATHEARGWLLLRELHGTQLGDQDVAHWASGLHALGEIQRSWTARVDELAGMGVPDRSLVSLERDLPDVLGAVALEPELRTRLEAVAGTLARLPEELAAGPLPETLIHGDFHPWNVMGDGDDVRIFDWSDACLSHPLFDLATFLPRLDDLAARATLRDAYLATWHAVAHLDELRALADRAAPLAQVHHAQSYLRILEALEPDDRWFFADVPRALVLDAVEQLEGR